MHQMFNRETKAPYHCRLHHRKWTCSRGALDISYGVKWKQKKKYKFIETAADEEKAREVLQKEHTNEDFQTTLTKKRRKANSNEHLSLPKKTRVDDEAKSDVRGETVEDEPGITYDFEYHDTINAETYEKSQGTKFCQKLYHRVRKFTRIVLLGVLIYKKLYCWVRYFYRQGFTFKNYWNCMRVNVGLKNKLI